MYFQDYVMPVYLLARDRMLPKVRDGTFCLHNAVLWVLNVLQLPCCQTQATDPQMCFWGVRRRTELNVEHYDRHLQVFSFKTYKKLRATL